MFLSCGFAESVFLMFRCRCGCRRDTYSERRGRTEAMCPAGSRLRTRGLSASLCPREPWGRQDLVLVRSPLPRLFSPPPSQCFLSAPRAGALTGPEQARPADVCSCGPVCLKLSTHSLGVGGGRPSVFMPGPPGLMPVPTLVTFLTVLLGFGPLCPSEMALRSHW